MRMDLVLRSTGLSDDNDLINKIIRSIGSNKFKVYHTNNMIHIFIRDNVTRYNKISRYLRIMRTNDNKSWIMNEYFGMTRTTFGSKL